MVVIAKYDLWPVVIVLAFVAVIVWLGFKVARACSWIYQKLCSSKSPMDVHTEPIHSASSAARIPLQEESGFSYFDSKSSTPAKRPAQALSDPGTIWLPPGKSVSVGDIEINSGLLYFSNGRSKEASSVSQRLPISKSLPVQIEPLPYYPRYEQLTPHQRRCYLEWLKSNRQDQHPQSREFGYVFLFFYGLERRVLCDGAYDPELFEAAADLMKRYSSFGASDSLPSYVSQFLHFSAAKKGHDYYASQLKWITTLPHAKMGYDELAIIAGHYVSQQSSLPVKLAYEIAENSELSRCSIVTERANEEFRQLFEKRYYNHYSEGLKLKCGKAIRHIEYRPANPSLLEMAYNKEGGNAFHLTVPDPFMTRSQFKDLSCIWNSCIDDLSSYSRRKGREESRHALFAALPSELQFAPNHPLYNSWLKLILEAGFEEGCAFLEVSQIATLLDIPQVDRLTKRQSEDISRQIGLLGFGCEPDIYHWNFTYGWRDKVGVFPAVDKVGSQPNAYLAAAAMLQIGFMIANADGHISSGELQKLQSLLVESAHLSSDDQQRLSIQVSLLKETPDLAKRTLSRVASHASANTAEKVGDFLIGIAIADGVVTKQEYRALEKAFTALGIDLKRLTELSAGAAEEPVVVHGSQFAGEVIPPRPVQFKPNFSLDMRKIADISAETSELMAILAEVMAEPESPNPLVPDLQIYTQELQSDADKTYDLDLLPLEFHGLLIQIAARDKWDRREFDLLCTRAELMPLSVIDAVNAWADETLGDFLLEGDDPIKVFRDILPKGVKL